MRSINPLRLYRVLARRRRFAARSAVRRPPPAALGPLTEPTIYADVSLVRVLAAVERDAPDLQVALADYARVRRAAGVRPENVVVELKRVLRHGLIELYFAA